MTSNRRELMRRVEDPKGGWSVDVGMTDDDWVRRLKSEPGIREPAIEELRELLVRGLSKSLSGRFGSTLQVDDVVQEALLKILDSLDRFAGRSRFTTWAMTIATRVGISELRRRHYRDVSLDQESGGSPLSTGVTESTTASGEQQVDRSEILALLQELIDRRLTQKQRTATQFLLDGLPVEEVARRMNSNRNAIYKLIHDGRSRLRDGFAEAGFDAHDIQAVFA